MNTIDRPAPQITSGQRARDTRKALSKRFPRCFGDYGQPKKPLKVGIFKDLIAAAPELGCWSLQLALRDYTGGRTYLSACREGASRFDLTGQPCGTVSANSAFHARRRLEEKRRAFA